MNKNAVFDRILNVYKETSKELNNSKNQVEKVEASEKKPALSFSSAVPEIDGNYLLYFNEIYTTTIRKSLKKILKKLTWSILKRQVYFNSAVRKIIYELVQKDYERSIQEQNISEKIADIQQRLETLDTIEQKIGEIPQLQKRLETLDVIEQKTGEIPQLQQRLETVDTIEQKLGEIPQLQEKIENLTIQVKDKNNLVNKFNNTEEAKINSGLWFNEPIIVGYRENNEAYWAGTNERIFEKAFVLQSLARLYDSTRVKILDVGCAESLLSYQLASFNYSVTAIDIRSIALSHPNLTFVKTDICHPSLPTSSFDCVIALSTLEHIGLGWYGDESGENFDVEAVKQIHSLLKPEGSFILTVPYGKKALTPVHRIYDKASLEKLIENFQVTQILYGIRKDDFTWITVENELEASVKEHNRENYLPGAVAMMVCKKRL
jgi:2-polyprenyl-3-methyl-5-hydroxy-6-metoxy-1,4-benzoquinol methylase